MSKITFVRAIGWGFIGGLAGTIMMDLVMFVEFWLMNQPLNSNFAVIGAAFGGSVGLGVVIHYVLGPTLGLLFGTAVFLFDALRIRTFKKGLLLGILAGLITIPLGCVPTAILSGVPILEMISFSALPHLVWGITLGWIAGSYMRSS